MSPPAVVTVEQEDRVALALERIATALEQLALMEADKAIAEPANPEPPYAAPLPVEAFSQPTYQQPRRVAPPADPNRPPAYPCPTHGMTWKFVPAGVSKKNGTAYSAFWACGIRGCDQRPA